MAKSQTSKAAESPEQEGAPKKSRATKGAKTAGKSETKTTKTSAKTTKSEPKAKATKAKSTKASAKAGGDTAAKSRSRAKKQAEPSREDIARRAHQLFEERGGHHGYHNQDWEQAERELREGR